MISLVLFAALSVASIGVWSFWGWNAASSLLTLATAAAALTPFFMGLLGGERGQEELDDVSDQLAKRVKVECEKTDEHEMGDLRRLPVNYKASDPADGRTANDTTARPQDLDGELGKIADVFARVPTRRLVVLGEGGAGKSVLARKLTLDLLQARQPGQPVPMLLSVASWNPSEQPLDIWLTDQLADYLRHAGVAGHRQQQSLAHELVDAHRILPLLDGFDEIPEALRGEAIRQLNKSRATKDELLLTSRIKEYTEAVRRGKCLIAAAVVEIQPLWPEDVAAYLRAPGGAAAAQWRPVVVELTARPQVSPVALALTTPLMVSLADAIYNSSTADGSDSLGSDSAEPTDHLPDPRELLDKTKFPCREAVEGHLLDRFIPAAYGAYDADRKHPNWDPYQAVRWHTYLARYLSDLSVTDFAWWELWRVAPRRLRSLTFGLAAGLTVWLAYMLLEASANTALLGAAGDSLIYGVIAGLAGGWVTRAGLGSPPTRPSGGPQLRPSQVVPVLATGLVGAILGGLIFRLALATNTLLLDPAASPILVTSGVLAAGFLAGSLAGSLLLRLVAPAEVNLRKVVNPREVLARDRTTFIVFGLISWPLTTLVSAFVIMALFNSTMQLMMRGVTPRLGSVPETLLMIAGVVIAFVLYGIGLVWGWSRASWGHFALARGWLASRHTLPWRLMAFLNDAYERGVLRQSGPYYQFRHKELRDRLAGPETRPAPVEQQYRSRVIDGIYSARIEQGPEVSLRTAARLRVGLVPDPPLVQAEFRSDLTAPGVELSVQEAFERAHGRLLIAGEPGSGKTVLALELMRHLLDQARRDPAAGVPELFPLASWTRQPRPLEEWLEDELRQRGLGSHWVRGGWLIPILDGLDEVDEGYRTSCLEAIDDYYDGRPLVVTCRLAEYRRLVADRPALALGGCYVTQPLPIAEIDEYLEAAAGVNPAWVEVRQAIARGAAEELCRLWRAPLMLSITVLAYTSGDPRELLRAASPTNRVWDAFVEAMHTSGACDRESTTLGAVVVQGAKPPYTSMDVRRWLGWLASSPAQRGEIWSHRLEPPLARHLSPRRAQAIASGVVYGLLLGLGLAALRGVYLALLIYLNLHQYSVQWLGDALDFALVFGSVFGLVFGLAGALVPHLTFVSGLIRVRWRLVSGLVYALVFWLADALAFELFGVFFNRGRPGFGYGLAHVLQPVWYGALIFGLAVGLAGGLGADPSYAAHWSISRLKRGLVAGLVAWLAIGGLLVEAAPVAGLVVGLAAGLVAALVAGLVKVDPPRERLVNRPTYWLNETARSGLIFGLAGGLILGLVVGLFWVWFGVVARRWNLGLMATTVLASSVFGLLTFGSIFGWAAILWHIVLRLRCWRRGLLPFRLVTFLDWSAEHLYLKRSGGAYRWVHPTFVDYLLQSSRPQTVQSVIVGGPTPLLTADSSDASPASVTAGQRLAALSPATLRQERPDQVAVPLQRLEGWARRAGSLARRHRRQSNGGVAHARLPLSPVLIGLVLALALLVLSFTLTSTLALRNSRSLRAWHGHNGTVRAVVVTPDGRQVVSGSNDKTVRVWDLATGRLVRILGGHRNSVAAVAVTPDGRQVVSSSFDSTVRVWDLATGRLVRILGGDTVYVWAVAVTPDGRQVVGGSNDNTVRVWDLATGRLVRILRGHINSILGGSNNDLNAVLAVAVTRDGRVVSGSTDRTVRVWDLATGRLLRTLEGHTQSVIALAVRDSRQVVSGDFDNTLRVWDPVTGRLVHTWRGYQGGVRAVAVTPDGGHGVTGSDDGTIRVWNLTKGKLVHTLHTRAVHALAVTPDGRQAVSGSNDGTIQVWDLSRQRDHS